MAIFKNKSEDSRELGFGSREYQQPVRFITQDGTLNVRRTGLGGVNNLDIYHWLTTISRTKLSVVIIVSYIIINLIFGSIYYWIGPENFDGVDNSSKTQQFLSLFFFSAQTITTLGYGHLYPISNLASTAASFESLLGLLSFAIATGVLFGRFSRPRAQVLYSRNMLIAPYRGGKGLMFRVVNKKQYELIESEVSVTLAMNNPETKKREFLNLQLEISRINFLALSWTIVHPLDEKSPLFGLTLKELEERDAEVLILLKAISDTFSQTVYSRGSYKSSEIVDNARFKSMFAAPDRKGKLRITVSDIHLYETV